MTYRTRTETLSQLSLAAVLLTLAFLLPTIIHAQTSASSALETTIRAELLSDPRTSTLTSAQLDAMVSLLAQQAQAQGVTAQDLTWHPQPAVSTTGTAVPAESCDGNFTCVMDEAFGFIGPDTTIPFGLGMASMGLIWILAEMIHRHRYPHVFATPAAPSGGM